MPVSPYKWTLGDCDGRCADCPGGSSDVCGFCCGNLYSKTGTATDANGAFAAVYNVPAGFPGTQWVTDWIPWSTTVATSNSGANGAEACETEAGTGYYRYVFGCLFESFFAYQEFLTVLCNGCTTNYAIPYKDDGSVPAGTYTGCGGYGLSSVSAAGKLVPSDCDPLTIPVDFEGQTNDGPLAGALPPSSVVLTFDLVSGDSECPPPEPPGPTTCTPCDIPGEDLCFSWSSTESGAGAAALLYDPGTSTWQTGCVSIVGNGSISVFLSCSGGSWAVSVWYDTDHEDCSLLSEASLSNGQILMGTYDCDPFEIHIDPTHNIKLNITMGFTDFVITRGPCPMKTHCTPCDVPNGELGLSWTGPIGAGSSTLGYLGGYWQTPCEHVSYGGTPGALQVLFFCNADSTQLVVYWNDAQYNCVYPGPFGSHRDQTPVDPAAPGPNDHITLTASTCDPLSITFTVANPSDLYNAGYRTFVVTL